MVRLSRSLFLRLVSVLGLTVGLTVGLAAVARADVNDSASAEESLLAQLSQITSMTGTFSQRQFDSHDDLLLQSSGKFRILRPGYFAWEIESPDRQTIIADPQYLWHHDLDLETATRRPVDASDDLAPLKILGGNASVLRERFEISSSAAGSYQLKPRDDGSPFLALAVVLDEGRIVRMELQDTALQRVLIEFFNVEIDAGLSPEDFAFTPPAGTDVFHHDE